MTTIRRITVSQIDGNDANANNVDEIRPFGETAFYLDTEQNNALTLMMFDGVRTHRRSKILRPGVFYGSNENSSDGNGFDTIKLIPDAALDFDAEYTNDQYIIIEPTGGQPGHVHIRSGGPIDQSEADLFLGGELNHVKVSDTSDTVTISTDAGGEGATRTWTFDSLGKLQFPGGSNGRIGEDEPGLVVYSDLSFGILTNLANTENSRAWIFTNDNRLVLPSNSTITSSGEMRFKTTRVGFDIDTDFDVESADDVWIDALGNDARLSAANVVRIRSGTLNMYPTNWFGEGDPPDFTGTWDGNTLTIVVANGPTTLMTLLDYYLNDPGDIWIKTSSGYAETDSSNTAIKTVGESTTTFQIPTIATSPAANATVLRLKLYDSINPIGQDGPGTGYTWTFEKDAKLTFPNGGAIEPVGMGWMGVTNGISGNPVSILNKNTDDNQRSILTLYNSDTYGTAEIITVYAPGIPDGGNINTATSTGSWDANPRLALSTTGGSGAGLTVDVNESGSGYSDFVTVVTPGSGYVDGETITVTSGEASATFVINVQEYNRQWTFNETGITTLPGAIQGNVKSNTYVDTVINLDVNAAINKLTPTGGGNNYYLADGVEGQIMHIACATGGETATEATQLDLAHARWTNGAGVINEQTDVGGWLPFAGNNGGSTILTLVFIDGHWNLPHYIFD